MVLGKKELYKNLDIKKKEEIIIDNSCKAGLSTLFLIDNTSSMFDYIEPVKSAILSVSDDIVNLSDNNYSFGLILFDEDENSIPKRDFQTEFKRYDYQGEATRIYFTVIVNPTNQNEATFKIQIHKLNDTIPMQQGSGGTAEPYDVLLEELPKYPEGKSFINSLQKYKTVVLITDAIPSGYKDYNYFFANQRLRSQIGVLKDYGVNFLLMDLGNNNLLQQIVESTGETYIGTSAVSFTEDLRNFFLNKCDQLLPP